MHLFPPPPGPGLVHMLPWHGMWCIGASHNSGSQHTTNAAQKLVQNLHQQILNCPTVSRNSMQLTLNQKRTPESRFYNLFWNVQAIKKYPHPVAQRCPSLNFLLEPEPSFFGFVFLGEPEPELAKLDRPGSSWSRDRVAWTSLFQRNLFLDERLLPKNG